MSHRPGLSDWARDLILGSTCVGCRLPGRVLCPECAATFTGPARHRQPDPCPPGLVRAWSVLDYDGIIKAAINGHKEQSLFSLRRPLGTLLARAVAAAVPDDGETVALVAIPSSKATVRARGHDPLRALVRVAADALRGQGYAIVTPDLLIPWGSTADQVGLSAEHRFANLGGSLSCSTTAVRRLARQHRRARLVVCDDVLTTGATAREAQRALEEIGLRPAAVSTIASTRRRASSRGYR